MTKPTIKDIAAQSGVSIATVSRVLANKSGSYSEKTAAKILKIAKELGYRKNSAAVDLVKKGADVIALIINATPTNFSTQIIDGIQQRASELGQGVIILYAGNRDHALQHQAIITALGRSVSGILLAAIEPDEEDLTLLKESQIPFCFVSLYLGTAAILAVSSDNRDLAYQATQYLIDQGHTRIGLVGIDEYHTGSQRRIGYQEAMTANHLAPATVLPGDYSYEAGVRLLQAVKDQGLTAVLAASDMVAAGILTAAQQHKIRVPADLSIMSIDGTIICQITTPALTSVTQDFYQIGRQSVNKVMGQPALDFVPVKIVERASVVPPAD
ncbi:LacI family DNA-binding transcriptional regulator [Levilactobacillus tujiorum]|uniref:LacI family DNA-binding transcriptional regulator n=1 Tax=Levilactobacillus tujiorum TaxID=2912243 RepID=UPI0014573467|nr:LacI family DNA-binding transcriptional regulator [Levilactobacillus tujiorum]NLR32538.1 LacI family transcriptional regulator [Levilactobacillus tujiorum]